MRMRKDVEKVMLSASPRSSGPLAEESLTVRNWSRAVWSEKADGLSGTGMTTKDSSGEMAVALALRMPYLSQLRYLNTALEAHKDALEAAQLTFHGVPSN